MLGCKTCYRAITTIRRRGRHSSDEDTADHRRVGGGGERHADGAQALANTRLRAARRLRRAYARSLARPEAAVLNPEDIAWIREHAEVTARERLGRETERIRGMGEVAEFYARSGRTLRSSASPRRSTRAS